VAVNPMPRAQIAANLVLDRLDVDTYWPDQAPPDLLTRLAGPLRAVDAAIQAKLARLTWRGVHLQDVGFAGRSVNGRLTINELTVSDLAEAEARVAGLLDLAAGTFDLSAELHGIQAARLLRRLGFEPSPLLARLEPLTVEGVATGSLEAVHLELEAGDGAGKIDLAGEIGWTGQQAHYEFEIDAAHPDYHELLEDLGAGSLPGDRAPAPLALSGTVQREIGGASAVAGTARFGETSFTGKVAWLAGQDRPHIAARISVGEPTAPVLGGLLDLTGLRLEWPAPHGGFRGRWSERPLALALLDRFDGELVLSSKGGLAGDGLELDARLADGRLTVEHVSLALWQGRLQGELSFDVRRPLPHLTATLDLEAFDPAELAAWLGVPAIVAGPATLHVQATGAGDSARALVGSLMGAVELVAPDGAMPGALPDDFAGSLEQQSDGQGGAAEPAGLAASFALERGVLVAQPMQLDFGDIAVRLEGAVDLYLWAVDLTLRPDAGGPVLKAVGPLHRPQVRLIGAVDQASPAPRASP
jgi:AsmA-like C-terminal region